MATTADRQALAGLLRQADAAAASGNLTAAIQALGEATRVAPDTPALWLRLAAMHRAVDAPKRALEAVHRALAIEPLDFTALVLKASLLDRLGEESGQAWEYAIAQRPRGELPAQLAAALAEGERRHASWLEARERRMAEAMADAESLADEEARRRIGRFRSNVLRKTRPFHSEPTHFHFPELSQREFHPRRLFPWIETLEAATDPIAREFEAVVGADRAELVPYIQYSDHEPLGQWRPLNRNPDWTAVHLLRNGELVEANARHCPATMALLERVPQPDVRGAGPNAMFSLLAPRTAIPAHVGVNNARLVCHLPLIVPERCWFRVGATTREWRRGEAFVFDDTIEHEAMNPSDQLRVVFIFDVWHPDLAEAERAAVKALIETEGAPAGEGL